MSEFWYNWVTQTGDVSCYRINEELRLKISILE